MGNDGRFIDRLPIICPAGIRSSKDEDVSTLLKQYDAENLAECFVKRKEAKKKYKKPELVKTVLFEDSVPQALHPYVDSFSLFEKETMESRFYKLIPLAKSRKFNTAPPHIYANDITFGDKPEHESLYNLIMPPKKVADVLKESQAGHDLYLTTHGDYNPSEQVRRGYGPPFNRKKCFGISTNVDASGAQVRRTLESCDSNYVFKNSIQDEIEQRKKSQVGRTHDRTGGYCNLKTDNTFMSHGIIDKWEFSKARLLIYNRPHCPFRTHLYNAISYLNTLRRKIKTMGNVTFINNIRLKIEKDWHTWEEVYEILNAFSIPLHFEKAKLITNYFRIVNDENKVNIHKLVDLLDILIPLPEFGQIEKVQTSEPSKLTTYREMISDSWRNECSDADVDPADAYLLSKPRLPNQFCKAMIESLPEETTVKSLISPSIPTIYGLSHRDYLLPRSKDDIRFLFTKADFEFTEEEFEECWEAAKKEWSSAGDMVSVEAFMFCLYKHKEAKKE